MNRVIHYFSSKFSNPQNVQSCPKQSLHQAALRSRAQSVVKVEKSNLHMPINIDVFAQLCRTLLSQQDVMWRHRSRVLGVRKHLRQRSPARKVRKNVASICANKSHSSGNSVPSSAFWEWFFGVCSFFSSYFGAVEKKRVTNGTGIPMHTVLDPGWCVGCPVELIWW